MGENNITLGPGAVFFTNADGLSFKLGEVAKLEYTEELPMDEWPKENPHLRALGRTNGRTDIDSPATFTCAARINKKGLHKCLNRFPYNPKRRWRNERKARKMVLASWRLKVIDVAAVQKLLGLWEV